MTSYARMSFLSSRFAVASLLPAVSISLTTPDMLNGLICKYLGIIYQ